MLRATVTWKVTTQDEKTINEELELVKLMAQPRAGQE
jgi:hypothetical protein